MDYQRILFNLHRKQLPTEVLKIKADKYIEEGLLKFHEAELSIKTIEAERSKQRMSNDACEDQQDDARTRGRLSSQLTINEMEELLKDRLEKMKQTEDDSVSDQYRVYKYITDELENSTKFLRIMIQARRPSF